MYSVYILYSKSRDKYYVGYTNNLERRISEHNRRKGKFTDTGIPWEIVYTEQYCTKKEAMNREKFIKSQKSKDKIIEIITGR
ncbi:MAG: GIY-YIG nuclease family protein [Bacteroidales bacterium]|jgi:putative endonuclease|nr:GIY-YIG nuclease family protein [Bacteroidales bacterium]